MGFFGAKYTLLIKLAELKNATKSLSETTEKIVYKVSVNSVLATWLQMFSKQKVGQTWWTDFRTVSLNGF